MNEYIKYCVLPVAHRHVVVVNILNFGKLFSTKRELELHAGKFNWVDKNNVVDWVVGLRTKTETNKKSVIAVYEEGKIEVFFLRKGYCTFLFFISPG